MVIKESACSKRTYTAGLVDKVRVELTFRGGLISHIPQCYLPILVPRLALSGRFLLYCYSRRSPQCLPASSFSYTGSDDYHKRIRAMIIWKLMSSCHIRAPNSRLSLNGGLSWYRTNIRGFSVRCIDRLCYQSILILVRLPRFERGTP